MEAKIGNIRHNIRILLIGMAMGVANSTGKFYDR